MQIKQYIAFYRNMYNYSSELLCLYNLIYCDSDCINKHNLLSITRVILPTLNTNLFRFKKSAIILSIHKDACILYMETWKQIEV